MWYYRDLRRIYKEKLHVHHQTWRMSEEDNDTGIKRWEDMKRESLPRKEKGKEGIIKATNVFLHSL